MLANGMHSIFFTCDVDDARISFQIESPATHTQDALATPTTDDGSRLLTPAEITSFTAEVSALVASLPVVTQSTPLIPRAPWMLADDSRSNAEADAQ
jgi:hypothetical protein